MAPAGYGAWRGYRSRRALSPRNLTGCSDSFPRTNSSSDSPAGWTPSLYPQKMGIRNSIRCHPYMQMCSTIEDIRTNSATIPQRVVDKGRRTPLPQLECHGTFFGTRGIGAQKSYWFVSLWPVDRRSGLSLRQSTSQGSRIAAKTIPQPTAHKGATPESFELPRKPGTAHASCSLSNPCRV